MVEYWKPDLIAQPIDSSVVPGNSSEQKSLSGTEILVPATKEHLEEHAPSVRSIFEVLERPLVG